jgi:hypothetical protein
MFVLMSGMYMEQGFQKSLVAVIYLGRPQLFQIDRLGLGEISLADPHS